MHVNYTVIVNFGQQFVIHCMHCIKKFCFTENVQECVERCQAYTETRMLDILFNFNFSYFPVAQC